MRVRYTGPIPTMFIGVGEVEPGGEFDVPDEVADRYLQHGHIEPAGTPTKAKLSKPTADAAADQDQ